MKLSIITINYNNKAGLQKTIDSVICQTWKDYEWIIIDGGSSDGSKKLIEQYQQYFAYWCSEPDKGVYNAMNKGIAKAKGEYLNFMNSGDVFYENNTLQLVFENVLYGDMVYGDWICHKGDTEVLKTANNLASLKYFYSDNICHQAMFIKSSILKEEGYDTHFSIYADWARWLKMAIDDAVFQYLPLIVCRFDATDGLSNQNRERETMHLELEHLRSLVPTQIRDVLDENIKYRNKIFKYEGSQLIQDVYSLITEHPIYRKLIHLSIESVKLLKRLVALF
jgi:glycosyltransferase involved in cell wall biosynthesis